jgi:hypothetical protein
VVAGLNWSGPQGSSEIPLADPDLHLLQVSLWQAIVTALGDRPENLPLSDTQTPSAPVDFNEFLGRLGASEVGVRGLVVQPTRDVAVVAIDRAEVLLVFGQIAPSRVAAPNESSRFRVVAALTSDQLAVLGGSNADLARDLIAQLLFLDANVVSVQASSSVSSSGQAPPVTVIEVADAALGAVLAEQWARVFGEFEIKVVEVAIEGVDATIIIGMNYVPMRTAPSGTPQQGGAATTVAPGED